MGQFRAAILLSAFFLSVIFFTMPVQWVALTLRLSFAKSFPHHYYKFLCRLLGIRIELHGTPATDGPLLFAANHTSYLDIPVLGALVKASFVAKQEVRRWPVLGGCASLSRTIFVDRHARNRAVEDRDRIQERLRQGDRLILFPEGTSSNGNGILPFKSSLLSVAEFDLTQDEARSARPTHCRVQPVSITYTRLNGLPMGRIKRPLFAWYGDMDLMPHLWSALAAGPIDVTVEFHAPVTIQQLGDRKLLAGHCEKVVRDGVINALSGRMSDSWAAFSGANAARGQDETSNQAPTPLT